MSKFVKLAAVACIGAFALQAQAHGPSRQKTEESVTINAPASKVWALVGDFNGLPKWLPPVATSTATDGNKVGSIRTLTLKNNEKLEEMLTAYDASKMEFRYRAKGANVKALPVNDYSSSMTVEPEGATKSKVEWKGAFYRGYMNNDPPKELNDDAALNAVNGLYKMGLQNLKKVAESGQ